jgi:NTE family protein
LLGQSEFFAPRFPPAMFLPHGAPGAISVYDTAPLKATLEDIIDFDRINAGQPRLSLGAVNVRTGNFAYFDNSRTEIGVEHVMASGALPPGFPPVEIDGDYYWDGGLVSNTPLVQVLDDGVGDDTLVFQVDLFSARGDIPGDLIEAEERRKHITFSSRTRLNTDQFREKHRLRQAIVELFERLPAQIKQEEPVRQLRDLGDDRAIAIVHLIYRRRPYEGQAMDYEFSRASMLEHWRAGLKDARLTLKSPKWLEDGSQIDGLRVYDLTRE